MDVNERILEVMPCVNTIVRRMSNKFKALRPDDIRSEAYWQVSHWANNTYDPKHGVPFAAYVNRWLPSILLRWCMFEIYGMHYCLTPLKVSLDALTEEHVNWVPSALRQAAPTAEQFNARLIAQEVLRSLPERKRRILVKTVMRGDFLEEVGDEEGVTRERIRQIRNEALRDVREHLGIDGQQ